MRILVIDDDDDFRLLVSQALKDEGYQIVPAADGAKALELLRHWPADLVITDLIMPNKEGIETIRDIRQEFPKTKIIAVTGGGRLQKPAHLFTATELGASTILRKPFAMDVLVSAVRQALAESGHST